eukprot:9324058-Karenia_brevis.AAC.1
MTSGPSQNQVARLAHHRVYQEKALDQLHYPKNITRTIQRTTSRPPVHDRTKTIPEPPGQEEGHD